VRSGNRRVGFVRDVASELFKLGGELVGAAIRGGSYVEGEKEVKKIDMAFNHKELLLENWKK